MGIQQIAWDLINQHMSRYLWRLTIYVTFIGISVCEAETRQLSGNTTG